MPVITHGGSGEEEVGYVDVRNAELAVNLCETPGGLAEADLTPPPQLRPIVVAPALQPGLHASPDQGLDPKQLK